MFFSEAWKSFHYNKIFFKLIFTSQILSKNFIILTEKCNRRIHTLFYQKMKMNYLRCLFYSFQKTDILYQSSHLFYANIIKLQHPKLHRTFYKKNYFLFQYLIIRHNRIFLSIKMS